MHQECAPVTDVNLLSAKLHTLHTDVADIKGSIKELTSAINKLALVEERISNAVAATDVFEYRATSLIELPKPDNCVGTDCHNGTAGG